ncbi:RDD family protein [Hymenobacter sp. HDW8]|uniref:RDD family protein n=1 Tax=Hymenobacter sp. HDW8 TaxID=2714932 RepID=UPI001407FAC6|nr:RDD family protein [Hymenobacter sp. HDW8]QIL77584.1 RDD family protein [Hymenobacter sp. HDW8]
MEQLIDNQRTGFRRVVALLFDAIVIAVPFLFISTNTEINEETSSIFSDARVVLPILYSVFMNYRYGQTLGKMVAGIRVSTMDKTNTLTLRQAILRDSIWIGFAALSLSGISDSLPMSFALCLSFAFLLWPLADIITMLANPQRRAAHDFIAGTVVVKVTADDRVIA